KGRSGAADTVAAPRNATRNAPTARRAVRAWCGTGRPDGPDGERGEFGRRARPVTGDPSGGPPACHRAPSRSRPAADARACRDRGPASAATSSLRGGARGKPRNDGGSYARGSVPGARTVTRLTRVGAGDR